MSSEDGGRAQQLAVFALAYCLQNPADDLTIEAFASNADRATLRGAYRVVLDAAERYPTEQMVNNAYTGALLLLSASLVAAESE